MKYKLKKYLVRAMTWGLVIAPLAAGYHLQNESLADIGWAFLVALTIIAGLALLVHATIQHRLNNDPDDTEALVTCLQILKDYKRRGVAAWTYTVVTSCVIVALAAVNGFTVLAVLFLILELICIGSWKAAGKAAELYADDWDVVDGVLRSKHQQASTSELQRKVKPTPRPVAASSATSDRRAAEHGSSMTDPLSMTNPLNPLSPLSRVYQQAVDHDDCATRKHRSSDHSPSCSSSSFSSSSDSGSSGGSCSGSSD